MHRPDPLTSSNIRYTRRLTTAEEVIQEVRTTLEDQTASEDGEEEEVEAGEDMVGTTRGRTALTGARINGERSSREEAEEATMTDRAAPGVMGKPTEAGGAVTIDRNLTPVPPPLAATSMSSVTWEQLPGVTPPMFLNIRA